MSNVLELKAVTRAERLHEPARPKPRSPRAAAVKGIRIGIVNNMPDSALLATERQFTRLAQAAAGGRADLRLFFLPSLARGEETRQHLAQHYQPISALYRQQFDALIITGNEPKAARLDAEPYWPDLIRLADWARENTRTTLWSCLAAHAAVLHLDGIERHRMAQKKSGVLSCEVKFAGARGLPAILNTCHSRLNELRKDDLLSHGYEIVSEAEGGHVDVFTKTYYRSRFVFLQGHPEYERDSLMREYRRDAGRFLRGERHDYPEMPENYFDAETRMRMQDFRAAAEATRDPGLVDKFPAVGLCPGLEEQLVLSATSVFANWMAELRAIAAKA